VGGVLAGLLFGQYSKITKTMNVPIMMALTFVGMILCVIAPSIPGVIIGGFLCGALAIIIYLITVAFYRHYRSDLKGIDKWMEE
jgi:energy-converting hydrogenase Eha subunit C